MISRVTRIQLPMKDSLWDIRCDPATWSKRSHGTAIEHNCRNMTFPWFLRAIPVRLLDFRQSLKVCELQTSYEGRRHCNIAGVTFTVRCQVIWMRLRTTFRQRDQVYAEKKSRQLWLHQGSQNSVEYDTTCKTCPSSMLVQDLGNIWPMIAKNVLAAFIHKREKFWFGWWHG